MKNLYLLIMMLPLTLLSQTQTFYKISDSLVTELQIQKASSDCDESELIVQGSDFIPINYSFLETNGFCYNIDPMLQEFTLSFTFTATSTSIFINTGYSVVACTNVNFSNLNLYDNTNCAAFGSGFVYNNLVIGNNYTWSVTGESTGQFCEGFSTVCPYYVNIGGLPIELISFTATLKNGLVYINWITGSETNVNYFILERTDDLTTGYYTQLYRVKSKGVYNNIYETVDLFPKQGVNYYRIKEVDYNGNEYYYYPISFFYDSFNKKILKIIDVNGKKININTTGHQIIIYEDGTFISKYIMR